ncbi:MAG: ATPase, T2SS/T4P/T4SS family [Patescibacteria group bacterium]|nr:Flp pilus assembly complex ATPase component TadA [Patescibacteria group bacterium]MBU0898104.1 Flp pilus assembly complex ATPase component TadA [Patescibacteria group bacterium]MBU1062777.1 Flp pilus assembly complex ATPase component TadA [Patescibacteria group bacterium]MBU1783531.1 Flp pilus assembly complex ATPase component TadA [Patescibacteria group bacterium]
MEIPSIFLNRILTEAAKNNTSDLHLVVGSLPMARIGDQLAILDGEDIITSELLNRIVEIILSQDEIVKLKENREIVLVKELANNFRFRISIFYQKNLLAITFHYIPIIIKTMADLMLPSIINDFIKTKFGLLIVAGSHSSGRTTTIASVIEEINKRESKNIVTLEDPIEFLFTNKKSLITQRQIGYDVKTFSQGLNYCLKEDVDLIYISEIDEEEEFILAMPLILELSAGNCMVILEFNGNNSTKIVEKILGAVGKNTSIEAARHSLTDVLFGVVIQKLVPQIGGGLVLATEVLLNNSAVKSLIREGRFYQIESIMQTSRSEGMVSLKKSLEQLLASGKIRQEDVS